MKRRCFVMLKMMFSDIDECQMFLEQFKEEHETCINTDGSFQTSCQEGFQRLEGGFCEGRSKNIL